MKLVMCSTFVAQRAPAAELIRSSAAVNLVWSTGLLRGGGVGGRQRGLMIIAQTIAAIILLLFLLTVESLCFCFLLPPISVMEVHFNLNGPSVEQGGKCL